METSVESSPFKILENSELEELEGKVQLRKWLNMNFRIEMVDGRVLLGVFLCTDRDANVILGACSEYLKSTDGETEEPRVLGLVMVPGRHIVSIQIDDTISQKLGKVNEASQIDDRTSQNVMDFNETSQLEDTTPQKLMDLSSQTGDTT